MSTLLSAHSVRHRSLGFTLIEVLIVVATLSLLGITLLTSLSKQRTKAEDARIKTDLERLRIAFEEYYNDNQCYPPSEWFDGTEDCNSENLKPYLALIPCNPKTATPYKLEYPSSQCSSFKLYSTLSNLNDPSLYKFCVSSGGSMEGNYGVSSTNTSITTDCSALPSLPPSQSSSSSSSSGPATWGCQNSICNDYQTVENAQAHCTYTFTTNSCDGNCSNPIYSCH